MNIKPIGFGLLLAAFAVFISCNKTKYPHDTGSSYPCMPPNMANGMLVFYAFSNGSIHDFSGSNHHLLNNTGAQPAADREGNPGCAFAFDGSQFLTVATPAFLDNLTQFSISLWYMPADSARDGIDYETLICRDTLAGCPDRYGQWSVSLFDCRKAVFAVQNSVWDNNIMSLSQFDCAKEVAIRTGSWHHLAATYDAPGNVMKIYRDGVLQASGQLTANCGNGIPAAMQNTGNLFLGKHYKGRLDDVIIYNRALTQAEITQLSQAGACCGLPE